MPGAHITQFIARHENEAGEEIFAAHVDSGKIRIGYKGGPIIDYPAPLAERVAEDLATAADFDVAENILMDSEL